MPFHSPKGSKGYRKHEIASSMTCANIAVLKAILGGLASDLFLLDNQWTFLCCMSQHLSRWKYIKMQEKEEKHECNSDALGGLGDQREPQYETLSFKENATFNTYLLLYM